jgi:hypothetical protein
LFLTVFDYTTAAHLKNEPAICLIDYNNSGQDRQSVILERPKNRKTALKGKLQRKGRALLQRHAKHSHFVAKL